MRRSSFSLEACRPCPGRRAPCGVRQERHDSRSDSDSGAGDSERTGESGISYQMLVYSFADSDGDGCGDFKGIQSRLDYLKEMGVQAIWLSPIHPASSYHGYDVLDYSGVNPDYGTEADFKSLLDAAHAKGIKIYLDYVLNHTSKDHPWFLDAKKRGQSAPRLLYLLRQPAGRHPRRQDSDDRHRGRARLRLRPVVLRRDKALTANSR